MMLKLPDRMSTCIRLLPTTSSIYPTCATHSYPHDLSLHLSRPLSQNSFSVFFILVGGKGIKAEYGKC